MNSKNLILPALLLSLGAMASVPVVSNVTTTQNSARRVIVNYTLSEEPGIVTLTAQTNRGDNVWVDVDDANLTYVSGDVNKVVPVGDHSLTWLPHKSWPDQLITGGNIRIGVKAWATNAPPDYMVVSLVSSGSVEFYSSAAAVPFGVTNDIYKTDYLVMRKIPAANVRWRMGSPVTPEELGRNANEVPHEVMLTNDYYIGIYPVTQRQYQRIQNSRPAYFSLESDYMTRPVEQVSFEMVRAMAGYGCDWPKDGHKVPDSSFIGRLRTLTGVNGFDLPTEAQWEFACRAGSGAALYDGNELVDRTISSTLNPLARYAREGRVNWGMPPSDSTAAHGTAKVGSYLPNAWGIYDMLGNVKEWCLDYYQDSPIGFDVERGPESGEKRVSRGANFNEEANMCRCAWRSGSLINSAYPSNGFRLACSVDLN